jgi:MoaA/NifB/PqqE/SkfB family radical SAM enzyme
MDQNTIKENLKSFGIKKIVSFLDSDPDKNIPRIVDWAEKIDVEGTYKRQLKSIKKAIENKDGNWYLLMKSLWTDIDDGIRKTVFKNFIVNATMLGGNRQRKAKEKYGCNIPWAILMDPTSACNLKCKGCWAADYGNKMYMDYETLNKIILQGKALGTFMYIYSGGEPLLRKDDIVRLCEKHDDCMFLAFTNGTLIDESFADEMLRVKNFVPAISVEGFEEATDYRRGKGTYGKAICAMDILRKRKLFFGFSSCYTSRNADVMGSEEYIDEMINRGAKFGWFFTYIPVGIDAVPELMATSDQREFMYHQIREFRKTKPLFTLDFWNDGEYVKGCIAGGRSYLHINANGDIEPCAFIHYSDSNIHKNTLVEAFQSPLFMQYYKNQPFNDNHLRPCPLLDNPEKLESMVLASGAKSTEMLHPEDVRYLCGKCKTVSDKWAITAGRLWANSNDGKSRKTVS